MFLHPARSQKLRFTLGILFFINSLAYVGLALLFLVNEFFISPFTATGLSFITLLIILPLTGLNLAGLFEYFFRQNFTFLEKIFLATLLGLTVPALFVSAMFTFFALPTPALVLIFSLASFLAVFLFHPGFLDVQADEAIPKNLWWTLGLSLVIYTVLISIMVTSYYALPDLDPYYWLRLYQEEYVSETLTLLSGHRPLFSALNFIFTSVASIDFYAYFKYVLPFFLLICLLPLALIAKNFKNPVPQILVFSIPLVTPSFILYTLTPIPQAILNIGVILFSVTLLHSYFTRNNFFFLAGGIFILITSLYHEVAIIFFLFWLVVSFFFFRKNIKKIYSNNPYLLSIIAVLLLMQFFKLFKGMVLFLSGWFYKILMLILQGTPNLNYPATYINIDGNAVGWGTPFGVFKYYMFYAGGIFFLLLALALTYYFLRKPFIIKSKETWVLFLSALFFLFIAEIFPRLFNIAILPERAWGFVIFFCYCFFIIFLSKNTYFQNFRYHPFYLLLFVGVFSVNIGGALYVNNLKQYLITPAQIQSAEWIKYNLPKNRVLFTYNNESLLRSHSQSPILHTDDPDFYHDIRIFNKLLRTYRLNSLDLQSQYNLYIQQLNTTSKRLATYEVSSEKESFIVDTLALKKATDDLLKYIKNESETREMNQNIYIYFAKPNPLNPYSKRPYSPALSDDTSSEFIFDQDPKRFQRIYYLPNDEIVIWQYVP